MKCTHRNSGTCSSQVQFDIQDGKIYNVVFKGGCNGSAQGIAALIEGMDAVEARKRLKGIS
ncbi:MAG: TSCPD domain-containing protein [Clostridia bacterium]|nr:TSCPD domain-containing protein [Clostridia bacterium]